MLEKIDGDKGGRYNGTGGVGGGIQCLGCKIAMTGETPWRIVYGARHGVPRGAIDGDDFPWGLGHPLVGQTGKDGAFGG